MLLVLLLSPGRTSRMGVGGETTSFLTLDCKIAKELRDVLEESEQVGVYCLFSIMCGMVNGLSFPVHATDASATGSQGVHGHSRDCLPMDVCPPPYDCIALAV